MNALPELTIEGTVFQVDVMLSELREKENPLNVISFYSMEHLDYGYRLNYFPDVKNTYAMSRSDAEGSVRVIIPEMVELDPERVAKKYEISNDQLPVRDTDLRANVERFQIREMGILPRVNLCDKVYIVDLEDRRLTPLDDRNATIYLNDLPRNDRWNKRFCIYNTETGGPERHEVDLDKMTDHLQMIVIPEPIYLDPYYMEQQHGLQNIRDRYPINPFLELEKYPVSYHPGLKQTQKISNPQVKADQKPQRMASTKRRGLC